MCETQTQSGYNDSKGRELYHINLLPYDSVLSVVSFIYSFIYLKDEDCAVDFSYTTDSNDTLRFANTLIGKLQIISSPLSKFMPSVMDSSKGDRLLVKPENVESLIA